VGFWQPAKPVFARLLPFIGMTDNKLRYVLLFQGYFNSPRAQLQSTLRYTLG
jgi:hypothetical protein